MSYKTISVMTTEGNDLGLLAHRRIVPRIERKGLRTIAVHHTNMVTVQYGIGVAGEGATLKEAVSNFRENWTFFCNNRAAIVRGEMPGWE